MEALFVFSGALELQMNHSFGSMDTMQIKALCIPCSFEVQIETLSLDVSCNQYYMDEIARKLDARDASHLLVSKLVWMIEFNELYNIFQSYLLY